MRLVAIGAAALLGGAFCISPAFAEVTGIEHMGGAEQAPLNAGQVVPAGTPVRLMFLKEINSRTAVAGQRFKLRVDEPIYINGKPVVPVGTAAWGEIVSVDTNGAVGRGGTLGIQLLYLDLPEGRLPLKGEAKDKGGGNGAGVVLAVVGFGILGLLTQGDSARFKGGELITAYVDTAIALEPGAQETSPGSSPAADVSSSSVQQPIEEVPRAGGSSA